MRVNQREQYEKATAQARELEPGSTVSIVNPRQDSRGKWLYGVVAQRLGPANYLVRVEGGMRYVHIDQMRYRDERSAMKPVMEPADIPTDHTRQPVAASDTSVGVHPSKESTPNSTPVPTTTGEAEQSTEISQPRSHTEGTEATATASSTMERRYPTRTNRQPPLRYRQV